MLLTFLILQLLLLSYPWGVLFRAELCVLRVGFVISAFQSCFYLMWFFFLIFFFNCRGCLFYGPPGTGKTLLARALANECSQGHMRVAFFMRKGAECLSKWIGESERQLRLLFEQVRLKCAMCSVWVGIKCLWPTTCFVSSFHWNGIATVSFFSEVLEAWNLEMCWESLVKEIRKSCEAPPLEPPAPAQKKNEQKNKTQTQQAPKKSQKMFQ